MYYVHWKSLFIFGILFWISLCITDFLGEPRPRIENSFDEELVNQMLEMKVQSELSKLEQASGVEMGWSVLIWNIFAFISSILLCSFARSLSWLIWRIYKFHKNQRKIKELQSNTAIIFKEKSSSSKIPILMTRSTSTMRGSDTNIKIKAKVSTETSCPDLINNNDQELTEKVKCQTLFKNKLFSQQDINKFDRHLEAQCNKLREEMLLIQATSLKEHAILSRKLEAVSREKKELSKQLAVAQKENRAAKQQLEELLQEKSFLIKKLENATNEFKTNTKTKKVALAKLEEVTTFVESLKQQLEQVTRDKEILEKKLRVLEEEYEKLQERMQNFQNRADERRNHIDANTPEREDYFDSREHVIDMIDNNMQTTEKDLSSDLNTIEASSKTCLIDSQTEIDMKKIQVKIEQLEKNLENFNAKKPDFRCSSSRLLEKETWSEMSTPRTNDRASDTTCTSLANSPRFRPWGISSTIVIDKMKTLHNIRERNEVSVSSGDSTDIEYSSNADLNSYDERTEPHRIVSSSIAFQTFLKNLNTTENVKKQFFSNSEFF